MNFIQPNSIKNIHKLSIAPMMDCTDKHFRMIMRKISSKALLYTEMIVAQSLIYTNENYSYKDCYSKKHRYFYLKKNLQNIYKFERIIFQKQDNNKLGIVVHSKNIELINSYISAKDEDVFKQKIITNFNKLFEENSLVHKLTFDEKISIMNWRASQPSGLAVPLSLQFSRKYKIGFCGDWFEGDGFGRIEGSILSALILEKKIKDLIK